MLTHFFVSFPYLHLDFIAIPQIDIVPTYNFFSFIALGKILQLFHREISVPPPYNFIHLPRKDFVEFIPRICYLISLNYFLCFLFSSSSKDRFYSFSTHKLSVFLLCLTLSVPGS